MAGSITLTNPAGPCMGQKGEQRASSSLVLSGKVTDMPRHGSSCSQTFRPRDLDEQHAGPQDFGLRLKYTTDFPGSPACRQQIVEHLSCSVAQMVKTLPACNAGDPGSISGLGRHPGEGIGNPLQYSCLEKSTDRGVWWAHEVEFMGSSSCGQKVLDMTEQLTLFTFSCHKHMKQLLIINLLLNLHLYLYLLLYIAVVQSLNHVRLFGPQWTTEHQVPLTISLSLLKVMSIESGMLSNHYPLPPPSPALSLSQNQGLFQ